MDFDFDVERMIGSVVRGTLKGRRKRSRGVQRLLGRRGGGLLNASSLLALAGVAWGLYDTATAKTTGPIGGSTGPGPGPYAPSPGGSPSTASPSWPTPSAGPPPTATGSPVPASVPVPGVGAAAAAAVPEGVLRVIRLTLAAARADGTLTDAERDSILSQSGEAGATAIIERELASPTPLAQVVAGVSDPAQREDLYTLAFAIVRADESVTGGERVFLAQLAHQLGLEPDATARLEAQAARRIDEAAKEGQP